MSQEKNKKISIRQQGVAWFFVFLMSGSFLFGEKVLAVNDYTKATSLTPVATSWNNIISNYDKPLNGTLSAFEWNGLANDFVKTWATSTMVGPLGIGTAASSAYKLDINGLVRATSFTGSYVGTLNSANVSSGDFGTNTGGGNYSFPGKLGIGTTNPGAKLDVFGSDANNTLGAGVNGAIRVTNNDVAAFGRLTELQLRHGIYPGSTISSSYTNWGTSAGSDLIFSNNNNTGAMVEYMRIKYNGNVGIGTTNPGSKFDVVGMGASNTPLTLIRAFNNIPYATGNGLGAARIELGHGNVLHGYIEAGSYSETDSSSGYMAFGNRRPTNAITEVMRINSIGNVGIGTTNPGAFRLNVVPAAGSNGVYITNVAGNYNSLLVDNNNADYKGVLINHTSLRGGGNCGGDGCYGFKFDDKRFNNLSAGYGPSFVITRSGTTTVSNLFQVDSHGVNGLAVSDSGYVGIGTTAPASKLTISGGDLEMDNNKSIKVSSASADTTLLFGNYADGLGFYYGTSTQATNKTVSLAVEGDVKADRLCIEEDCKAAWSEIVSAGGGNQWITSGNNIYNSNMGGVAIGTSTPGVYKLYVNGNANINGTITATNFTGSYGGTIAAPNVSAGTFADNTGGGNFSFPGNVGIGTTNPTSRLQIASGGGLSFAGRYKTYETVYSVNTATPAVLVDDTGAALDVNKSYRVKAYIPSTGTETGAVAVFRGNGTTFTLLKNFEAGINSNHIEFYLDTNVPKVRLYSHTTLYQISVLTEEVSNKSWAFGPEVNLYSNPSGYVGIGTTNPQAKLDVYGGEFRVSNLGTNARNFRIYGSGAEVILGLTEGGSDIFRYTHGTSLIVGSFGFTTFKSGGAERIRIDTVGNVGIGTTTPAAKLDVLGQGFFGVTNKLKIQESFDALSLQGTSAANDGTKKSIILNAWGGNVGIGTTNPDAYKLNVNGNTNISGTLNVSGQVTASGITGITIAAPNVSAGTFADNTGGGNFSFPGNVGIGTTSPGNKLEVVGSTLGNTVAPLVVQQGNAYASPHTQYVQLWKNSTGSVIASVRADGSVFSQNIHSNLYQANINGSTGTPIFLNAAQTAGMYFPTGQEISFVTSPTGSAGSGVDVMRITTTGNVGIGTTTPGAYKLYVNGNTNIAGNLNVTGSISGSGLTGMTVSAPNVSSGTFADNTGGGNFSFPGNVGIGTNNPGASLEIQKAANSNSTFLKLSESSTNANSSVGIDFSLRTNQDKAGRIAVERQGSSAVYDMIFSGWAGGTTGTSTEYIRIKDGGNVGIGTSNPYNKLDVEGKIGARSFSFQHQTNAFSAASERFNVGYLSTGAPSYGLGTYDSAGELRMWIGHSTISNSNILLNPVSGNVGVGTAAPNGKLAVAQNMSDYGQAFSNPHIKLLSNDTIDNTGFVGITYAASSAINYGWSVGANRTSSAQSNFVWKYHSNDPVGVERMRINQVGNVGIGTTDPGAYKLNVNGNTNISGALNVTGAITASGITGITVAAPNVSAGTFADNTGGGNFSFLGNLGVGTVNPGAKLEVVASSTGVIGQFSQTGPWNNSNYALSVSGYTNLNGFRINAADGIRGLYKTTAGGSLGFATIGDDPITFTQSASNERMRIAAGGNVGIGTTTPSDNLTIKNSAAYKGLSITSGDVPRITLADNGGNTLVMQAGDTVSQIGTRTNNPLYFYTNSTADQVTSPAMAIINGGNVGIGTTTPGAYKLYVNGNTNINGVLSATSFSGSLSGTVNSANISAGAFGANTGGGNYSFPGNVGIGTTAPGAKLNVSGGLIDSTGKTLAILGEPSTATYTGSDSLHYNSYWSLIQSRDNTGNTNSAGKLIFRGVGRYSDVVQNVDILTLSQTGTSGNVGIGTTAPASKLTISGGDLEMDNNKSIKVSSASANTTLLFGNYADGLGFYYGTSTQATNKTVSLAVEGDVKADRLCIEEDCKAAWSEIVSAGGGNQWITSGNNIYNANTTGNVGIGTTTPTGKLHINTGTANYNAIKLQASSVTALTYGLGIDNSASFNIYDNGAGVSRLTINNGGNVGIGTTNPGAYKLYVNGNTNINGTISATSFSGPVVGTVSSANVSAGTFGSNTGGGNFSFLGNVGIGTNNPADTLSVYRNESGKTAANIKNANATGIGLIVSGGGSGGGYIADFRDYADDIKVRISGAGNVGIGTVTPNSKLDVYGAISVSGNSIISMPSNNPEVGPWNPIWNAIGSGKPLFFDEEFANGNNSVSVYNLSGGTALTVTRLTGQTGIPNSTGNVLKISYDGVGATNPGFGGFITSFTPAANRTYVQRFRAKLPVGKVLVLAENGQGDNKTSYWLTNTAGTGKWEDYIRVSHTGNTGLFANGGHVYVTGGSGAFDWYLSSVNVYEVNTPIIASPNTWNSAQTFSGGANFPGSGVWALNGSVGIGTITPGTYKLNVNGNTNISGNLNITGTITGASLAGTLNAANISAGTFAANTGGGNFGLLGSFGVGTATPGAKLEVVGNSIIGTDQATYLTLSGGASGSVIRSRQKVVDATSQLTVNGSPITFQIASTEKVRIDTAGNVGIGTTNPNGILDINGGASGNIILSSYGSTNNSSPKLSFWGDSGGGRTAVGPSLQAVSSGGYGRHDLVIYQHNADDYTTSVEVVRFAASGNVGINTITPTEAKLVINAGTGMALKAYGDGIFTGTLQTQTGSDFAEEFITSENLEPGTVVVMGDKGYKSVKPCAKSYDNTVVGIVSNNPSIIAGKVDSKHKAIIAMMGVVKVKVVDINGKINRGDMLTTSDISGYAMKAGNSNPGTIIGKALENLKKESGEINVLVNLQ